MTSISVSTSSQKGERGNSRRQLSGGPQTSHGCIYRHKLKARTPSRVANPKVLRRSNYDKALIIVLLIVKVCSTFHRPPPSGLQPFGKGGAGKEADARRGASFSVHGCIFPSALMLFYTTSQVLQHLRPFPSLHSLSFPPLLRVRFLPGNRRAGRQERARTQSSETLAGPRRWWFEIATGPSRGGPFRSNTPS